MELSVNRNTVRINEPVLDTSVDHPLECDVVLPDYCPDIARILSTDAGASINKKTVETDCLTADGIFCVKIIYVPDNSSSVRCFTYENDFTHTFEAEGLTNSDMTCVSARVDYITCRQIGPRRLQIKASVAITAKAVRCRNEEVIGSCDDNRVEMLSKTVKESSLVGMCDKVFDVEQELEIGYTKPAAAAIIKCDAVPVLNDYKVIKNKIITKGDLILNTMYLPDVSQNNLEVVSHTVPISQIIDLEGVEEDSICSVSFTVLNIKLEASPDADGENRMLNFDVTLDAAAKAYNTQDVVITEDAYSPVYETEVETKPLTFERISDCINSKEAVKFTVEAPGEGITSVCGCTVRVDTCDEKIDGKNLVISGDMTASIIAADLQGSPVCFDKTMPYSITLQIPNKLSNMRCESDIKIVSTSFSFSSGSVDIRCECCVSVIFFEIMNCNPVCSLNLDESAERKCRQKTLTLYYADKGERIWDIAKRYNTSCDAIMKENDFETETVPERLMLLIPKKHCAKEK